MTTTDRLRDAAVRVSATVPISTDEMREIEMTTPYDASAEWRRFAEAIEELREVLYLDREPS